MLLSNIEVDSQWLFLPLYTLLWMWPVPITEADVKTYMVFECLKGLL